MLAETARSSAGISNCTAIAKKEMIYVLPRDYAFLCINDETHSFFDSFVADYLEGVRLYYAIETETGFIAASYDHRGLLFVDLLRKEGIWRLEDVIIPAEQGSCGYGFDAFGGTLFIHNYYEGEIISIDLSNNEIISRKKTSIKSPAYVHCLRGEYLCLDYYFREEIEIYDLNLSIICNTKNSSGSDHYNGIKFGAWSSLDNGKIAYYNNYNGELRIYSDLEHHVYNSYFLYIPEEKLKELIKLISKEELFWENEILGLQELIKYS